MPWWILEVATNLVLVAIALWLGPFIKRFGRAYAADVFHDNPLTGKSYIVLTDIVYYLIFTAYILFSVPSSRRRTGTTRRGAPPTRCRSSWPGSAASCSSSGSCTASTSCSCRCSAGCSRSTGVCPRAPAPTARYE